MSARASNRAASRPRTARHVVRPRGCLARRNEVVRMRSVCLPWPGATALRQRAAQRAASPRARAEAAALDSARAWRAALCDASVRAARAEVRQTAACVRSGLQRRTACAALLNGLISGTSSCRCARSRAHVCCGALKSALRGYVSGGLASEVAAARAPRRFFALRTRWHNGTVSLTCATARARAGTGGAARCTCTAEPGC